MNNYNLDELLYYKKNLCKYLKKCYEEYLEYLRNYYQANLDLALRKK